MMLVANERSNARRCTARRPVPVCASSLVGLRGGGKTQYALWLAKRIGRDVVLKRPSDLLSKYVGESEQQIAEFLQQIQEYSGFLIACINRIDAVDPAHADGAGGRHQSSRRSSPTPVAGTGRGGSGFDM